MKYGPLATDQLIAADLGRRLEAERLAQDLTQAQLAAQAGVSKRTVERLENGDSSTISNLIRCLRALGRLEGLKTLLPEPQPNPVSVLKLRGKTRQRARPSAEARPAGKPWAWGDER
ncbi:helix-turn-helix transcriptional regulator [Phenylobacterium sp.]|jgi:transcriptional regulator with XRE-family HTH domain|uniref:helix-turn-helix domain-containing protein n=1 Tax=Phenylobacterium sp. TaxID=1871053 RepID=UPI002E369A22|nr:helix-turn-helix transcriptional regulator [Phenylobacterium sp.]HEX3367834.1 helix-turn-helix transcriptional regulator [Phenylobacterium sp.]